MKPLLRIAWLSEHASPLALLGSQDAGGQNVYVDELSRQLGRLGYAVDIFTRRDHSDLPDIVALAPGVRVINLQAGPTEFISKDGLWMFMAEFLDAMLAFMITSGASYDLIHSHFWMSGWVAMQLRRRLGVPAVQTFHALGATKQRHQGEADTSPPARLAVERDIVREFDRLVAQCPSECAELIGDYDADARKISVIPGAVNIDRFRPVLRDQARGRIGLGAEDFVVVYVGRIVPRKGVRDLVHAFARLVELAGARPRERARAAGGTSWQLQPEHHAPFLKLLIVGGETSAPDAASMPELAVLRQLAEQHGIADLVQFAGKRQPDELREFYSAGDVMVTAPWYEPFGLTTLEAMACGLPVIGSAVGGLTFTIRDQVTGLLVPPRDPEALAMRLYQLLGQPDRRATMGHAARDCVEREFTWQRTGARTAALYQAIVQGHARLAQPIEQALEPAELFSRPTV